MHQSRCSTALTGITVRHHYCILYLLLSFLLHVSLIQVPGHRTEQPHSASSAPTVALFSSIRFVIQSKQLLSDRQLPCFKPIRVCRRMHGPSLNLKFSGTRCLSNSARRCPRMVPCTFCDASIGTIRGRGPSTRSTTFLRPSALLSSSHFVMYVLKTCLGLRSSKRLQITKHGHYMQNSGTPMLLSCCLPTFPSNPPLARAIYALCCKVKHG